MSSSLRPPERVLERLKNVAQNLTVIFMTVGAVFGAIHYQWTELATDRELARELDAHDEATDAHPPVQGRLKTLELSEKQLRDITIACRADSVTLGAMIVRIQAAEREHDRRLKASAASYYEKEFERLIYKGRSMEDAITEALRSPWYDRPR